ncbi:MarR family transcriptional regulator [Pseudomonas tremae]|uniref:MarR family transcriptional regulator n=1 Tax=Pseudomonas tremae TaxID=200454 RepID=A0AA40NYX1_9PSED|nr:MULTISPECIES: MarR family transcriptional regulator [Pseudomonas syringae group]KPY91082.1 MarR family transcriptional regulator [Pseudomonas tremae]RMO04857.1 MarR family transcriptional regulator [Pseudomonas coronafaciens pv. zizaniae]
MSISLLREQLTRLSKRLRQEAQNHPESWSQMLVLSAIDRMNGTATPSKIAQAENMQSSNLASLLRELDARELITRSPDTQDKRRTWIGLSEKGKAILQTSRDQRDQWLGEAIEACLTDEERQQLEAAGAIMEKLSAYRQSPDN